ncbi:hypothetical protein Tco_1573830, partial [Tanacetum coccineum]
ELNGAKIERSG